MAFFSQIPRKYLTEVSERSYHEQLIEVILQLQKEVDLLKVRLEILEGA